MRLGTADVLVRAKTDKFDKNIDKSKKKVKNFGESSKKQLAGLTSSFASLAGPAGVAALTASLAGVIAVGVKFEKQMATVRGIARANEKDFKLLSDAAKKMGATTEWSATQSAEALEFMALAGWNVQKSIEGLPLMLDAATASGQNLAETSDILTDTLTAMGLEIEDMGRLTDVMIGTTTRANTNFLQMGEALKEAAPYARAYGFEIEEVAALLGVVADAGIKAGDAGTGLKNTWINNAKAAKILGTDATDLIGTLRAANRAQWDTNQFAKVYGKIAGKTVLNIAAQIDKYEALAETLHDVSGETKELADIKLDTLIGDWNILKSSIEGLGIAIYASIVKPTRAAVQAMSYFISTMNDAVKAYAMTWQALGLASAGMIDFRIAILDGVDAVETFDEALGPEKLRLAFLERIIETGKYTSKVYWEAKKLRKLIAALPDIDIAKTKEIAENLKVVPEVVLPPVEIELYTDDWLKREMAVLDSWIKNEEKRLKLEKEINKQIHDELLSGTDFRLQELDAQYLNYLSYVKDQAALDNWYVKKYKEIMGTKEQAYLDMYSKTGVMSQEVYDILYAQYEKDRDDFIRLTGDKKIAQETFIADVNALNEKMEPSDKTWMDGAKAGLDDYAKNATDVIGNVQNAFESGFKSMEDALVDFCMTGKLDFADFANSIIRDMLRIYIQSQITGVLASAVGSYFGGISTAPASSTAPALTYVAQGGVFDSPGLSAHSNTVVDSPTLFSFAHGSGLMGEDGPEAIMPLTQLPGGDLGVKAISGNGGTTNIYINAVDSQSFAEAIERNPGAIVEVVNSALEENTMLRNTIKGTL